jgi:hypothetical protein
MSFVPLCKHSCNICWITIFAVMLVVTIILTNGTLVLSFSTCASSLSAWLVSLCLPPLLLTLEDGIHEEAMTRVVPLGFVWDCIRTVSGLHI